MIIEEDKDMDLGLALSDLNRPVDTELSTTLGSDAKASARSRVDMAFVASDSPSELVWSRGKGLWLKRTKCNLAEKPSCMQDEGPKKLVMLPPHSIRSRASDRNLPAPEDEFHVENAAATGGGADFGKSPIRCAGPVSEAHRSDNLENVKPVEEEAVVHVNRNYKGKALCSSKGIQIQDGAIMSKTNSGQGIQRTTRFLQTLTKDKVNAVEDNGSDKINDVVSRGQMLGLEMVFACEGHVTKHRDILDDPVLNASVQRRTEEEPTNLESQDSNDARINWLEFSAGKDENMIAKSAFHQERDRMDESFPFEVSGTPRNSNRMHLLHVKGKEKAVFGAYVDQNLFKDEENIHYTVKSRNSACLLFKDKKRWSFEQHLIVGNKRIKRQIQETSTTRSLVRPDSSFMNLLSKIVKGFAESDQYERTFALNLNRPESYQLGHLTTTSPIASPSWHRQSNSNACLRNHCMLIANECHSQVSAEDSSKRKGKRKEIDTISLLSKEKLDSDTSGRRKEVDFKENKIPPMLHPASKQIPDAANIFDVIRGLRLSRKDVLKWMNSPMSPSCLDGFFLRIWLRNREEGLGRTGYHVACINETQSEKTSQGSKNSIYINVGATNFLVESQYVSNHDFTEDELMAWWVTTSTSKNILSKAYFRTKVEQRKRLGL